MWDFRQLRWLYYLGWWRPANQSKASYKKMRTFGLLLFCFDFIQVGPELVDFYLTVKKGSLKGTVLNLNTTLIGTFCAMMIFDLIRHEERIKWMLSKLTEMEEKSKRIIGSSNYERITTSRYKRCQRLAKFIYFCLITSSHWVVRPAYNYCFGTKSLVMESWVPWDIDNNTGWALAYLIQSIHITTGVIGCAVVYTSYLSILETIFGYIDTLKFVFSKLDFSYPGVDYHSSFTLRFCVELHQDILSICHVLNNITRFTIFISVIVTTLILCLSIFELSSSDTDLFKISNLVEAMSCIGIVVFMFCWYCHHTVDELSDILRASYNNNWYNGRKEDLRSLNIMCSMIEKGVQFEFILPSNLHTFINVLKSAFSYFNFLKAMATEG